MDGNVIQLDYRRTAPMSGSGITGAEAIRAWRQAHRELFPFGEVLRRRFAANRDAVFKRYADMTNARRPRSVLAHMLRLILGA